MQKYLRCLKVVLYIIVLSDRSESLGLQAIDAQGLRQYSDTPE